MKYVTKHLLKIKRLSLKFGWSIKMSNVNYWLHLGIDLKIYSSFGTGAGGTAF